MATVSNYLFDNMTRIGNDSCDRSQRNVQNLNSANYVLENYYPACPMEKAIDFATNQPNVFFNGSHQVGIGGCNIEQNSELQFSAISKPKCRISLFERPFATVPYLGRGPSNAVLESQIQQGDYVTNKKSVNTTSEISYINHSNYPLIPSIQATVANPANLVEGVAADGWIRGGLPSRELQRDKDFDTTHTTHQY